MRSEVGARGREPGFDVAPTTIEVTNAALDAPGGSIGVTTHTGSRAVGACPVLFLEIDCFSL